jgi:hypothetical protein
MQNFNAQFQGVINTEFGQKILAFLNEEKTIVMLETATYLGRPAIEALVPSLETRFGDELKGIEDNSNNPENIDFDRLKQTMGHMVKVIMEEHNYVIDQKNVKIPAARSTLFSTAARYKKA